MASTSKVLPHLHTDSSLNLLFALFLATICTLLRPLIVFKLLIEVYFLLNQTSPYCLSSLHRIARLLILSKHEEGFTRFIVVLVPMVTGYEHLLNAYVYNEALTSVVLSTEQVVSTQ